MMIDRPESIGQAWRLLIQMESDRTTLTKQAMEQQLEIAELRQNHYSVMSILCNLERYKNKHGKCKPRSDRACTYCNAIDDLKTLVSEYKGPPIVASARLK